MPGLVPERLAAPSKASYVGCSQIKTLVRTLLLLAAVASSAVSAQAPDDFFPLALGNRWDYAWTTYSGSQAGGTQTTAAGFTVWTVVAEGTVPGGALPRLQIETHTAGTTTTTVCAVSRIPSPSDLAYSEVRFVAADSAPCSVAYQYEAAPALNREVPGFYISLLVQTTQSVTIGEENVPNRVVVTGMTDGWGPGTGYNGGSSWRAAAGIGLVDFGAFQTSHGGGFAGQGAMLRYARVGPEEYGTQAVSNEGGLAPSALGLSAGPTPFQEFTTLRYALAAPSGVRLTVTDALGRVVRRIDLGDRPAGAGEAQLSAAGLARGLYVVRLVAGGLSDETRVVVAR